MTDIDLNPDYEEPVTPEDNDQEEDSQEQEETKRNDEEVEDEDVNEANAEDENNKDDSEQTSVDNQESAESELEESSNGSNVKEVGKKTPSSPLLNTNESELDRLNKRVEDTPRSQKKGKEVSFGSKVCPTRHGCKGATHCDYSYGDYPY